MATPEAESNPPGQTALRYRAGTYSSFYETMLARLSNLAIDVPLKNEYVLLAVVLRMPTPGAPRCTLCAPK